MGSIDVQSDVRVAFKGVKTLRFRTFGFRTLAVVRRTARRRRMSIFGAPSTPVAGASALFAPAVTTPANVGGTPRATDANGDDARRKSDGWSPASRYQNLLSSVRALEHGRASERDRERARRALRVNETRLREMTFFEGRNAGDAARVASGRATLSHGGEARLGELDVEHASAIAVALDLNEIVSVELMVGAIEHGAPADDVVPAAIGIYMRERAAALESLLAVLRCADGTAPLDGVMDEELKDYADGLLRDGALFARLVKLVTAPPPGGPFLVAPTVPTQHVGGPLALAGQQQQATTSSSSQERLLGPLDKLVDIRGRPILRQECVAHERRLVVECLFHSARVSTSLSSENAQALLVLAGRSAEAMRDLEKVAVEDMPTGYGTIFAAAAMFTPTLSGVEAAVPKTDLAKAVATTINSPNAPPLFSFVRFAWAILALDLGLSEAEEAIKESLKNDALEAIDLVLKTGVFQDDHTVARTQNLELVHIILSRYLHHNLRKTSLHRMLTDGTAVREPFVENGLTIEIDAAKPMADVCSVFAELYKQEPKLAKACAGLKSFLEISGDSEHSVGSLVKLLELCTTIAQTSEGARRIFELLQRSQGAANWDRLLGALIGYVQRFMSSPDDLIDAGEEFDPREGDPEMNEADAEGLRAYLAVFKAVMENAERAEAAHWLMWLEHRIGAALMDALLQLYINPVPLHLKAALLDAIGALCWDQNTAFDVWQLLDQAGILPNPMQTGLLQTATSQRSDVSYIYSMIETHEHKYESTTGWLRLIGKLLAMTRDIENGPCADGGSPSWFHTRFIRDRLLGELGTRVHVDQTERWVMARDCVDHLLFMLRLYEDTMISSFTVEDVDSASLDAPLAIGYGEPSSVLALRSAEHTRGDVERPSTPGADILTDFLTSGSTCQMVMNILSIGAESLSFERHARHGDALEDCVLGALQLLDYILSIDQRAVAKLRAKHKDAVFYRTLDEVLSADMTQMANILGYVQYKYNPEITYTALKILRVLCQRVEHIVALLPPASRAAIVEGCASCLELAFAMVPPGDEEIPLEESASSAVDCATLVFELLHENLERAGANMSHLLLGFDITGASSEIEVSPFTEFNCLSVILELLEAAPPSMHASVVLPYQAPELAADLLQRLATCKSTAPPTLALLEQWPPHAPTLALSDLLSDALRTELPKEPSKRRSVMHHRSSILRLCAEVLEVEAPPAKGRVPEMAPTLVLDIMNVLLDNGREGLGAYTHDPNVEHGQFAVLELPKSVTQLSESSTELALLASFGDDVNEMREELSATQLLDDSRNVAEGGIMTTSRRGDKVIDASVVRAKLHAECRRLDSESHHMHGVRQDAMEFVKSRRERAINATLRIVEARNSVIEDATARSEIFLAWEKLVTLAVSRGLSSIVTYFDLRNASVTTAAVDDSPLSSHSILFELVDGILSGLCEAEPFGGGSDSAKAAPFCRLVHVIVSQLRQLGEQDRAKGNTSAVLAPSKCRALLRSLIASMLHRTPVPQVSRLDIISALLDYLAYCRPDTDGVSPVTKQGQAVAGTSVAFSQVMDIDIEKGNAAIIQRDATALVDLISRDAKEGSNDTKAITLGALEAMVAVCSGTGVGGIEVLLLQNDIAKSCLRELECVSMPDLVLNTPRAAAHSKAIEASLSLLLRMAQSEPSQMVALGTLVSLTRCRAIDAYADIHSASAATATMAVDAPFSDLPIPRARHHKLLVNVIRLVGSLLAAAPQPKPVPSPTLGQYPGAIVESDGIPAVISQTLEFVEAHAAVIHRVLADRASRPHLADLAELEATVNLVTRLLKGPVLPDPKLRLHGAMDVLTMTVCSESNKYVKYVSKTLGKSSAGDDMMLAASDDLRALDAADRMWRRFISIRSMILSVQRVLVNKGLTKFTFAASDGVVGDERPTVHLFGTVVMRLSLELSQLADARRDALKSIDHYKILRDGSVTESDLLARVALVESDIRTVVISTENALEVLYAHLQPLVYSGDDDSLVAPSMELNGGKTRTSEFGVLASFMLPGLHSLIQFEKSTLGLDTEFINMLARRVRDSLETSDPTAHRNRFGIA